LNHWTDSKIRVHALYCTIASDVLSPGDLAPSVREVSKQAAINPTTVVRAYTRLQDAGILRRRRGQGLIVTEAAAEICREQRVAMIRRRLRQVLDEARRSGLDDGRLEALVREELVASKNVRSEQREPEAARCEAERDGEGAAEETTPGGLSSNAAEQEP